MDWEREALAAAAQAQNDSVMLKFYPAPHILDTNQDGIEQEFPCTEHYQVTLCVPCRLRYDHRIESGVPLLMMPCRLRYDHGIESGVPVLMSTEKPRCKLVASEEVLAGTPSDYQVRQNIIDTEPFYSRILIESGYLTFSR